MAPSRKPSAGVVVIGILALFGSAICLLMGVFMLVMPLLTPIPSTANSPIQPEFFKVMMWVSALIYLAPAAWGISSAIGLFRLKEWARISTIVFSVLLIVMNGFGFLAFLLIPFPTPPGQAADPSIMTGVRVFVCVFALVLLSIGIWWLVFFNRPKVKQQFVGSTPVLAEGTGLESTSPMTVTPVAVAQAGPSRPLSLTVIAWLMLAGCAFIPLNLVWHGPAILFTRIITGWTAALYFLAIAGANLLVGIGLLRLNPAARAAGIAYYLFFLVNTAAFYFAPGGESRMMDLLQRSQSMFPWMKPAVQPGFAFDMRPFFKLGMAAGVLATLVPLYFLITRRKAYEQAAATRKNRATA